MTDEYEYKGLKIKIQQEENDWEFFSPRDNEGNLGTMLCWHPEYELGDKQFTEDDFNSMEDVKRHLFEDEKALIAIPLYLMDHSGLSMRAGSPSPFDTPSGMGNDTEGNTRMWDTTHVGYIYTTAARVTELFGDEEKSIEALREELNNEVRYYSAYLEGNAVYWMVEDADGDPLESCGGYLIVNPGDLDYVKEEAQGAADLYVKTHTQDRIGKRKAEIERLTREIAELEKGDD